MISYISSAGSTASSRHSYTQGTCPLWKKIWKHKNRKNFCKRGIFSWRYPCIFWIEKHPQIYKYSTSNSFSRKQHLFWSEYIETPKYLNCKSWYLGHLLCYHHMKLTRFVDIVQPLPLPHRLDQLILTLYNISIGSSVPNAFGGTAVSNWLVYNSYFFWYIIQII